MADKLKQELEIDPLGRGYSGMSDQQVADSLMNVVDRPNSRLWSGSEVLNAIDKGEFLGLTGWQQATVWDVLHISSLNPYGIEADLLIDIFGATSTTITTLAATRKAEQISRAMELGMEVSAFYVWEARNR